MEGVSLIAKGNRGRTMNELHLFAGAGGGILGGILLGHTTVCAVEIEPYCRKVLLQRQRDGILPKFPIWDDVCTFDGIPWRGKVDVICGGFPCQDISVGGKGAGITGERSGLWKEFARIISEIRPTYVFLENSPILTSRGLGVVLGDLAEMGYNARWCVLGADSVGAAHRRKRIWILAVTSSKRFKGWRVESKLPGDATELWSKVLPPCEMREKGMEVKLSPSCIFRNANDVASGVDRLKAIGNGQVPFVAALAWRTLSQ